MVRGDCMRENSAGALLGHFFHQVWWQVLGRGDVLTWRPFYCQILVGFMYSFISAIYLESPSNTHKLSGKKLFALKLDFKWRLIVWVMIGGFQCHTNDKFSESKKMKNGNNVVECLKWDFYKNKSECFLSNNKLETLF